jgi:hypothetical protein
MMGGKKGGMMGGKKGGMMGGKKGGMMGGKKGGMMGGKKGGQLAAVQGVLKANSDKQKNGGGAMKPNEVGEALAKSQPGGEQAVNAVKKLDPTKGKATKAANKVLDPIQKAVGQDKVNAGIAKVTDAFGITF